MLREQRLKHGWNAIPKNGLINAAGRYALYAAECHDVDADAGGQSSGSAGKSGQGGDRSSGRRGKESGPRGAGDGSHNGVGSTETCPSPTLQSETSASGPQ
jgi:hypothetical protein